jgi:hypothetical protein
VIGTSGRGSAAKTAERAAPGRDLSSIAHRLGKAAGGPDFRPYFSLFAGFNSLTAGADRGGVLKNTGISFETDGLTGYPTLDAKGAKPWRSRGLVPVQPDPPDRRQGSTVQRRATPPGSGSDYALGLRFQQEIGNAWILRLDAMHGWREGRKDIQGARIEIRRKL